MHWSEMSDCYNPSSHLYTVIIKAGLDGIPILPLCFHVGLDCVAHIQLTLTRV